MRRPATNFVIDIFVVVSHSSASVASMRNCHAKLELTNFGARWQLSRWHIRNVMSPGRPSEQPQRSRRQATGQRGSEAVRQAALFVLQLCQKCALTRKNNAYFKACARPAEAAMKKGKQQEQSPQPVAEQQQPQQS